MPHFLTRFFRRAARFHAETDGAVTVDFVVLTAGVVALAIFTVSPFGIAPMKIANDADERIVAAGDRIFSDDFLKGGSN